MGNTNSQADKRTYAKMFDSFSYAPVTSKRTEANYSTQIKAIANNSLPTPLMKTAYYGKWSMYLGKGIAPAARLGQCHVYDPVTDSIVIAYGADVNGNCLNDCWALNLKTMEWRLINNSLLSPRQYCSACLVRRNMVIFGGAEGNQYFSDLHYINLDNGTVGIIETGGTLPVARTKPCLFTYGNYLILWSGYDGRIHNGLYRVDLSERIWQKANTSHSGASTPTWCFYQGKYYIFGGSSETAITTFDPKTYRFEAPKCTGIEPPTDLLNASLVSADEYIFLIGGESNQKYMHIFALDVKRQWWFAFHIRPDNETLSTNDGIVNNSGLFMLPREHSASVIYSPAQRALVSVMGSKFIEPAPVFKITIDTALSFCHIRSDLYEMFHFTNQQQEE
ncbi:Kelch motif family protein [Histomonas meleagridis]|uniref:Kelch motif family protein n=1 Tax=Histomonas meleagridis TaxID=135588 RepID=UPI00355A27A6|nr:Kelch motif family protein [Histomonas meleagridis]KAH0799728.1 Kelch motif family protein [Histomonas meleagridis]